LQSKNPTPLRSHPEEIITYIFEMAGVPLGNFERYLPRLHRELVGRVTGDFGLRSTDDIFEL
jgi:hypothetical protein